MWEAKQRTDLFDTKGVNYLNNTAYIIFELVITYNAINF